MRKMIKLSPYMQILSSFIIVIFIGAFLLMLPISSATGEWNSFISSIFTATSAICVTGLVVNDVSITYSFFGKTVIMILIQLGGLGLLTFSSMMILLVSSKMGYYMRKVISEDTNFNILEEIPRYLKRVSLVVFGIEFIGALLLFLKFSWQMNIKDAITFSIFHSVSAFCNAGFSLFSNNLENYTGSIFVNIVITGLIILGGIGFSPIIDIYNVKKKIRRKVSNSTKLAIVMTIILIVLGMILTFILEYTNPNTLAPLNIKDKLLASYFQSVTMRTAGFNTFNLGYINVPTALTYIFLMFIGASPGSTGGGIKTTTFSVILLGIYNSIRGKENIEYRKRRISWDIFNKACAIAFISILYISFALFLITIFEVDKEFLELFFEVVSAFGTAGVSMGITADLSVLSKIVIIVTMFIGRVGPLTIMFAVSKRRIKEGKYKYPEETILIG